MTMTEKGFWKFLEEAYKEKGRVPMMAGSMDNPDPEMQAAGNYMGGHAVLPANYQDLPEGVILSMSGLLFARRVSIKTKEAVLMFLAHQGMKEALRALERYNRNPDRELRYFARLALDECRMWCED